MNKLHHSLLIVLLSSSLVNIAKDVSTLSHARSHAHTHTSARARVSKHYFTTQKLKSAWKNNIVKIGTVTAVCALSYALYALGVKYNIIAAPALLCATNNALQPTPQLVEDSSAPTVQSNDDNAPQLPTTTTTTNDAEPKKNNLPDGVNCLQQQEEPNSTQTNTSQPEQTTQTTEFQSTTIQSDNASDVANTNNTVNSNQPTEIVTTATDNNNANQAVAVQQDNNVTTDTESEKIITHGLNALISILKNAQQDNFN